MGLVRIFILIQAFLLLIILGYQSRPLDCINSNTVNKINIGLRSTLYNCKSGELSKVHYKDLNKISQINFILKNLEYFLNANNLGKSLILESQKLDLELEADLKSSDFLVHFQETLFLSSLTQLMPEEHPIILTLWSDILNFIIFNNEYKLVTQSLFFISDYNACINKIIPAVFSSHCQVVLKADESKFTDLSIWSLRPVLFGQFLNYYKLKSLDQKIIFNKKSLQSLSPLNYKITSLNLENYHFQIDRILQAMFDFSPHVLPNSIWVRNFMATILDLKNIDEYLKISFFEKKDLLITKGQTHENSYGVFTSPLNGLDQSLSKKEIWIVDELPTLDDVLLAKNMYFEVYKNKSFVYKIHKPSILLLKNYNFVDFNLRIPELNMERIEKALGFNPIQKNIEGI